MLYDLTHIWNLKNKLIDTENTLAGASGGDWGLCEMYEGG